MYAANGLVKPKTADDILDDRRQIEDLLAAWLAEWDAYCQSKGWDNPRGTLRPIEDILRERNAARLLLHPIDLHQSSPKALEPQDAGTQALSVGKPVARPAGED